MPFRIFLYKKNHPPEIEGILWMLSGCFWLSSMTVIIRHLSSSFSAFEIVFFRNLICTLILLPWAFRNNVKIIKIKRLKLYGYRSLTGLLSMYMFFYTLSILPLTEVVSITFTVPLITTLLAIIIFKEQVGLHRWIALLIGFSGVIIIMRPGTHMFNFASIIMLATAATWSVSNIMVKTLTKSEAPKKIVFYMVLITTPISFPFALLHWKTPNLTEFSWLILLAIIANLSQSATTHAFSKTDMNVVLPFDFSRLIFVTAMAYVFFGEVVDIFTVAGALVIFISSLYVARREVRSRMTYFKGANI